MVNTKTSVRMIEKSWSFLKFWSSPTWADLSNERKFRDKDTLPSVDNWFKALELTPFDKVRVVILGQDPYHTKGMAHGLAFSVQPHVKKLPPSLRNILQEYVDDLHYPRPVSGDLTPWAINGVLLLNTILTVEEGKPLSHAGIGWEKLTYEVVRNLAERGNVVFCLWGKAANEYAAACGTCPIVSSPHPSPLSKGFIGSKPFSRCNEELIKLGLDKIDWRLR